MPPFHGERMRAYGRLICEITEQTMRQWTRGKPFSMRESTQEISLTALSERRVLRNLADLSRGVVYFCPDVESAV